MTYWTLRGRDDALSISKISVSKKKKQPRPGGLATPDSAVKVIQKTQDTLTGLLNPNVSRPLNLGQLPLKEPVASQLGALCWFFVASHEFGKVTLPN
jgi:hypothetical protein